MCWPCRARNRSGWTWQQRHVKAVLAALPAEGWTRASAGAGAKGPRWYDWRWLPVAGPWSLTGAAGCWSGAV